MLTGIDNQSAIAFDFVDVLSSHGSSGPGVSERDVEVCSFSPAQSFFSAFVVVSTFFWLRWGWFCPYRDVVARLNDLPPVQ
jgi:hypothetical protein